jgi:hypothetical protein
MTSRKHKRRACESRCSVPNSTHSQPTIREVEVVPKHPHVGDAAPAAPGPSVARHSAERRLAAAIPAHVVVLFTNIRLSKRSPES